MVGGKTNTRTRPRNNPKDIHAAREDGRGGEISGRRRNQKCKWRAESREKPEPERPPLCWACRSPSIDTTRHATSTQQNRPVVHDRHSSTRKGCTHAIKQNERPPGWAVDPQTSAFAPQKRFIPGRLSSVCVEERGFAFSSSRACIYLPINTDPSHTLFYFFLQRAS